ncbi:MAG: sensor histidine kinase [Acidimicrobiales bacterium]
MRRRITFAILGTVAAALLLAGLGTLALTRVGARSSARSELEAQAQATSLIATLRTNATRDTDGTRLTPKERLARIRDSLDLEDVSLLVIDNKDQVRTDLGDPLPRGLVLTDDQIASLRNGEIVSSSHGENIYAGSPLPMTTGNYLPVLMYTRNVGPTLGTGVRWFIIASVLVLLVGALVAARLSRRLTKPLTDATEATARIAEGDLSVRLPDHGGGSTDELDDLARSINEMADSLARSRGLEQQFLLSVSHDLRTPLTSIQGYAEAIADGAVPDERAAAGIILAESRRLERLVRDLLDLAKLEARQFSLDLVPVDLDDLVSDSVDGFRREVEGAGLQLRLARSGTHVAAIADPDRLAQVVANLTENALKYASGSITLAVIADPLAPRVEVSDDGPGIASEDLPHVFERLYVAGHQPVRKEVGSGLGLAIVSELVDAMGGTVRAEAAPGGGARMVVTLRPASTPVTAAVPPPPPAYVPPSAPPTSPGSPPPPPNPPAATPF